MMGTTDLTTVSTTTVHASLQHQHARLTRLCRRPCALGTPPTATPSWPASRIACWRHGLAALVRAVAVLRLGKCGWPPHPQFRARTGVLDGVQLDVEDDAAFARACHQARPAARAYGVCGLQG